MSLKNACTSATNAFTFKLCCVVVQVDLFGRGLLPLDVTGILQIGLKWIWRWTSKIKESRKTIKTVDIFYTTVCTLKQNYAIYPKSDKVKTPKNQLKIQKVPENLKMCKQTRILLTVCFFQLNIENSSEFSKNFHFFEFKLKDQSILHNSRPYDVLPTSPKHEFIQIELHKKTETFLHEM